MYQITKLAKISGLSRSTLLYYDRIGLLSPSGRSAAGYRLYSAKDKERLALICSYRKAGLGLEDISRLLATVREGSETIIRQRLQAIGLEISRLQAQQRLLADMLKLQAGDSCSLGVDKQTWIAMLRAAGMDEKAMCQWHCEFEQRAPQAHHDFLVSLGIADEEVLRIRQQSSAA